MFYNLPMRIFQELNNDQLNGLANLCFDLAKGALFLAFFPASEVYDNFGIIILRTTVALFLGLVFSYIALVLLKLKDKP